MHLAAHSAAGSATAGSATAGSARTSATTAALPGLRALRLPDRASGAASVLDLAPHTSRHSAVETGTGRPVTVQVLDAGAPEFARQALSVESARLAVLGTHPNIVTLYRSVELDGQPAALVLQACPRTLADVLPADRPAPVVSVGIAIKLAGALETVHRAGLAHCAVQPECVGLSEFGEPVLGGFGAAAVLDDPSPPCLRDAGRHTAPELLLGQPAAVATDVYGLSVTLYELLAGHPAFRAYAGEPAAAVSLRVLAGDVAPVSATDVPLALSDLVMWGMATEPAARPPSVAWFGEELRRIAHAHGWPATRMIVGEPNFA